MGEAGVCLERVNFSHHTRQLLYLRSVHMQLNDDQDPRPSGLPTQHNVLSSTVRKSAKSATLKSVGWHRHELSYAHLLSPSFAVFNAMAESHNNLIQSLAFPVVVPPDAPSKSQHPESLKHPETASHFNAFTPSPA